MPESRANLFLLRKLRDVLAQNPLTTEYVTTQSRGEVVSYSLMTTINTDTFDRFTNVISNQFNVNQTISVYKIVYWAQDSRSNSVTRMSATLLVPANISKPGIVSFKHGTPNTIDQLSVPYQKLADFVNNKINNVNVDYIYYCVVASSGAPVVVADNAGFGTSVGSYNYLDPEGETYSQVDAIRAVRNLIDKNTQIFGTKVFDTKLPLLISGYSLGGMNTLSVADQLNKTEPNRIDIRSILAGGVPNPYKIVDNILKSTDGIDWSVVFLLLLHFAGNKLSGLSMLRPNIYNDVLPMFKTMYLDRTVPFSMAVVKAVIDSSVKNQIAGATISSATCDPRYIFNIENVKLYSDLNKELCNYTNNFLEVSSLKNIPINLVYGSADELCVFRSNDYSVDFDSFLINKLSKTNNVINVGSENQSDLDNVAQTICIQTKTNESNRIKIVSNKSHGDFQYTYFKILLGLCNLMA